MRALSPLSLVVLLALARTAHADGKADAARAALVAECSAFEQDYAASRSPKLLGNLGLCGLRLERDGEAIDAYSRYLDEDPDLTAADHARVAKDVQELEVSVGHLTLEADQPGVMVSDDRIAADGATVTNQYGPIDGKLYLRVRPGHHILRTTLAGYQESRWELDVFSAAHESHAFGMRRLELVLAPLKRPGRGARYGPWMLMGLGGAMLVAGTITGVVALNKANSIDSACPNNVCPSSFDLASERSSGKTLAAATDVLLVGGALAAAGGLTWLLLERRSERPTAMCTPAGCAVRIEF